jgi:hypothetical protein
VLAIGERVGGAAVERVPLRPYALLRVGVLIGGEVLVGGGVVVRAGMIQERSYADISNIRIIKIQIVYLLSRCFSRTTSRS